MFSTICRNQTSPENCTKIVSAVERKSTLLYSVFSFDFTIEAHRKNKLKFIFENKILHRKASRLQEIFKKGKSII